MPDGLPELYELVTLAETAPPAVRWTVGAAGVVLLFLGAKLYRPGLLLGAFAAGAIGGAAVLEWVAPMAPELGLDEPRALAAGALSTGLVGAVAAWLAHRMALILVGALAGLLTSVSLAAGFGWPWWSMLLGVGLGAALLPFVYPHLLKLLTPAVGALLVGWALHRLDVTWLLVLLWTVGAAWQVRASRPVAA